MLFCVHTCLVNVFRSHDRTYSLVVHLRMHIVLNSAMKFKFAKKYGSRYD